MKLEHAERRVTVYIDGEKVKHYRDESGDSRIEVVLE